MKRTSKTPHVRLRPALSHGEKIARLCREAALDKKAENIIIFDVRATSSVTDFFVLCSGNSEPHLKAIADGISRRLREEGVRVASHDGMPPSRWIVLDYRDVLVHIFHPEFRERYGLEHLWGDAPRLK